MENKKKHPITVDQLKREGKYRDFTAEERKWLADFAAENNQDAAYGEVITYTPVDRRTGKPEYKPVSNQSEFTFRVYTMVAIYDLYIKKGLKLIIDQSSNAYVMPQKVFETDPKAFLGPNFRAYKQPKAISNLFSYVSIRWVASKLTENMVVMALQKLAHDKVLVWADPVWRAITLKRDQIKAGKDKPVPFKDFYNALSMGQQQDLTEPYREKSLRYLLSSPLKRRLREHELSDLVTSSEGFQAVVILEGDQNIGKTTLVRKLALGWYDTIQSPQTLSQTNIALRHDNFVLEGAETSGSTKGDLEAIKTALTLATATYTPKYKNEQVTVELRALIIGTTNKTELLKDSTGERRFWPIHLAGYDWDYVTDNFLLRAFATELINLESEVEKIRTSELSLPEQAQAAQALTSLALRETPEDRAYKANNYSQPDMAMQTVKKYLTSLILANAQPHKTSPYLGMSGNDFIFNLKAQVDADFARWLKENEPGNRVYTGKADEMIQSLQPRAFLKHVSGPTGWQKKARKINGAKLLNALDLDPKSLTTAGYPTETANFLESEKIFLEQ